MNVASAPFMAQGELTTNDNQALRRPPRSWRGNRPEEDPEKTKRWGFINARPSEYLVHVRKGRVRMNSSGQGASCFKLPWDSVAIVPTSLQNVKFRADQVTLEKVGVEVSGFLVYRIVDPLMASRVLNFSYPERAQQKLEQTLTEMLMGSTRRLVANLSVDQCLSERKSALADELLKEIAPVLGGHGRVEDATDQGWGVVVDTIEIQEVRIRSEQVFSTMQAPFRTEIERRAQEARAQAEASVRTAQAEMRKKAEEATLSAEASVRERRSEFERSAREEAAKDALRTLTLERDQEAAKERTRISLELERAQLALETAKAKIALDESEAKARHEAAIRARELKKAELEADLMLLPLLVQEREKSGEVETAQAALKANIARIEADSRGHSGRVEAEVQARWAESKKLEAEARAQVVTAEKLPELAAVIGKKIESVQVTQFGAGEPVLGMIRSLMGLVATSREAP